jgi:exonuclease III
MRYAFEEGQKTRFYLKHKKRKEIVLVDDLNIPLIEIDMFEHLDEHVHHLNPHHRTLLDVV